MKVGEDALPVTGPQRPLSPRAARFRSLLYTPADQPERYGKAWTSGAADIVCADLEDAVAPERKDAARSAVADALRRIPDAPVLRAVRINAWPGREAEADLDAVLPTRPDLIVLPKAEDPDAVAGLSRRLADAEAANGMAPGGLRLIPILETALGVLRGREIAASPRVAAVCFGAEDLAADVGMRRSPGNQEVAVARGLAVLAAAAARVPVFDMITADFDDLERCRAEAEEARRLGFSGKMCIHPKQVAVVHAAFAPSPGEVAWANRVMAAVTAAGVGKGGVIVLDGKMVDVPVIRQAERILASV